MNNLKVLIIDPHNYFSQAAAKFLLAGDKVAAVETVGCAAEALKTADLFRPDLLLLDDCLLSEEFAGSELLSRIRRMLPEVKIVFMSLYPRSNNPAFQPGCRQKQVYEWVSKQDFAAELPPLLNGYLNESG